MLGNIQNLCSIAAVQGFGVYNTINVRRNPQNSIGNDLDPWPEKVVGGCKPYHRSFSGFRVGLKLCVV